jgi:uncharacterized protein YkwD
MLSATMRLLVAAVTLLVLACVAAAQTAATPAVQLARQTTLEAGLFNQLNELRAARGLRPLMRSPGLQVAAVTHSRAMLEGGWFEHDAPNGAPFTDRVRRYYPSRGGAWSVGENLYYASPELVVANAFKAWMSSDGHRRNLLGASWREVGIGVLYAPAALGTFGGRPTSVVTMDFGARAG